MDWLRKLTGSDTSKHRSPSKKTSAEKRYYVKPNDKKIVAAYKNPSGSGYVYHKRSSSGIKNVPIKGHTHSTEKRAKEHLERLRKSASNKKT